MIYNKEMESIIRKTNPDQILVEIARKDLKSKRIRKYPKEMQFAYKWAKAHKKKSGGFDFDIDITKKNLSKAQQKIIVGKMFKLAKNIDWKDFNKRKYKYQKEQDMLLDNIIDHKKHKLRQRKMLSNIRKMMIKNGTILILTGASHLNFFEKHLKNAEFPFRR